MVLEVLGDCPKVHRLQNAVSRDCAAAGLQFVPAFLRPDFTQNLPLFLVAPSSRVPPGAADSMHNLLTSAKQFRWRVIDEYAQDFRDMVDSGTVTDEQWRRLRNMTEEIDRAVRESNGLQLNNTMYELFTPEGRIRIAESTQDWNPCLTKLQRIISSPASVSPSKLVTELVECFETMRRINRALFEQACTEFSGKLPNYFFLDKELRPRLHVTIGEAVTRRTDPDNHPPVAAAP